MNTDCTQINPSSYIIRRSVSVGCQAACQASWRLTSSRLSETWRMTALTAMRRLRKGFFLVFFFVLQWQCNPWNWKRWIIIAFWDAFYALTFCSLVEDWFDDFSFFFAQPIVAWNDKGVLWWHLMNDLLQKRIDIAWLRNVFVIYLVDNIVQILFYFYLHTWH